MPTDQNIGPRQITNIDLTSINLTIASLWETLDGLAGLRGNAVVQSPITIGGVPSAPTDSARLMDVHAFPADPWFWLLR